MIIQLSIEKVTQGVYEVHCDYRQGGPSQHNSISEALGSYGQEIPEDFCQFVEIHYGGISSGTTAVARLKTEPQVIAQELVALVAEVSRAEEEIALLQIKKRSIPNAKA